MQNKTSIQILTAILISKESVLKNISGIDPESGIAIKALKAEIASLKQSIKALSIEVKKPVRELKHEVDAMIRDRCKNGGIAMYVDGSQGINDMLDQKELNRVKYENLMNELRKIIVRGEHGKA